MSRARIAVLLVIALTSLASVCYPAARPRAVPDRKPEGAISETSPAVVRKVLARVSRQDVVRALLADAQTRSLVVEEGGIGESQLDSLATKPLPAGASKEAASVSAAIAADEADYRRIDWTAGVDLTPSSIPTYGSGKWSVGALAVKYAEFKSWQPDSLVIPTARDQSLGNAVVCHLELPLGPGLYAVCFRLVRQDGMTFTSWTDWKNSANMTALMAAWWDANRSAWGGGTFIGMTLMPGGQGFVGLISAKPSGYVDIKGNGMRRVTSRIELDIYPSVPIRTTEYLENLVFGGITVVRL